MEYNHDLIDQLSRLFMPLFLLLMDTLLPILLRDLLFYDSRITTNLSLQIIHATLFL